MRWSTRQKALCFRGLAVQLNSGVHVVTGLGSLAVQAEEPEVRAGLQRIAARLGQGHPLPQAMQAEGGFSALETGLVKVGVDSGSLHTVLMRLADLAEKKDGLTRKLISALVYPGFVLALCVLLLVFAPVFVFSDLLALLRELKTDLPLATRLYLGFNSLVLSPLFYLLALAGVGGFVALLRSASQHEERRRALEELLFSLPGVGSVLKSALAATVAQAIATCYAAGIPILRAVSLSREVTWSVLLQEHLETVGADLRNGHSLADALKATEFFSPMSLTILAGGEEVGLIAEALNQVEKTTTEATEHALEALQKLVEPFILLFIGLLVGFIAIATLAPTLQVVQQI